MPDVASSGAAPASGGEVRVLLEHAGPRIVAATLGLHRPLAVVRVALGRTPEGFLQLLPMLFPLCGMAHGVAALRAIENAMCVEVSAVQQRARDTLCLLDALAAHAWRAALDWPALCGARAEPFKVAAARRAAEATVRALYPDGDWLRPGGGALAPDAAAIADLLPRIRAIGDGMALDQRLVELRTGLAAAFAGASPDWVPALHTRFRVTAAQARHDAQAAVDALAAQGAVASVVAAPELGADGGGRGTASTARGPLAYAVTLRGARVRECSIDAPIDRAFGAGCEAQRLLASIGSVARPSIAARWLVAALDPCAPVTVEARERVDA